jgi:hypothetical protein
MAWVVECLLSALSSNYYRAKKNFKSINIYKYLKKYKFIKQ